MSLTILQKKATAKELQENYRRLGYPLSRMLADLEFTEGQLEDVLAMRYPNPGDVWKLRDYLVEKLSLEGKECYPFTALANPAANRWFSYRKTWK